MFAFELICSEITLHGKLTGTSLLDRKCLCSLVMLLLAWWLDSVVINAMFCIENQVSMCLVVAIQMHHVFDHHDFWNQTQ